MPVPTEPPSSVATNPASDVQVTNVPLERDGAAAPLLDATRTIGDSSSSSPILSRFLNDK